MKNSLNRNLFFVGLCLVLVAGCKKDDAGTTDATPPATTTTTTTGSTAPADAGTNTLVGSWDQDLGPSAAGHATNSFEFKDDGTFTGTTEVDDPKTGKMTIVTEGTYKLDGDKFTQSPTSMKATADTDAGKATAEGINKYDLSKIPKSEGTAKWTDKDNVTITLNDPKKPPIVLKRKSGAAAADDSKPAAGADTTGGDSSAAPAAPAATTGG
ncbi:MAG TPA: hypothetical protein VGL56_16420 [Fimbriimonadaceae bacterium]|jgi:hypothetical protein